MLLGNHRQMARLMLGNGAVVVTQLWRREQCNWCPLDANSEIDARGQITLK